MKVTPFRNQLNAKKCFALPFFSRTFHPVSWRLTRSLRGATALGGTMTEPFTRLEPAPEVSIDKSKYVKTLKLLALRVPKVRRRDPSTAHPAGCFASAPPPPPCTAVGHSPRARN